MCCGTRRAAGVAASGFFFIFDFGCLLFVQADEG